MAGVRRYDSGWKHECDCVRVSDQLLIQIFDSYSVKLGFFSMIKTRELQRRCEEEGGGSLGWGVGRIKEGIGTSE